MEKNQDLHIFFHFVFLFYVEQFKNTQMNFTNQVYINEYWHDFKPLDIKLHYVNGLAHLVLGVLSFATNIMVLFYFIK